VFSADRDTASAVVVGWGLPMPIVADQNLALPAEKIRLGLADR
jgi:hypothetical protein